ncbi:PRC-barrel domain-containing protein [Pararoseomonas indoligenes]|uniref:PRC-barrel domain-containing protein n=1 Tax=Roseomonas indoligenes TaxID=2820811 RepID=A0A940MWA6_9PROT|nr:PRC-barrel domain-containing protein [Pararoseomonas indoligenes]MBP0491979.1 PRC-barrel domain-containing protein [Pararoseomonas indoligenes]
MRLTPHRQAPRFVLLLAFAGAPAAMAQVPAAAPAAGETPAPDHALPATPPVAPSASPAAREELPRGASQRIVGREVIGPSGDVVGRIVNVLLDDAGQPRAAVLDYGGFLGVGRRRVAVAWRTLRFSPEIVRLELTRDQMRAFPDYREGEPVVVAAPPAGAVPAPPDAAPPAAPQPAPGPGAQPGSN